MRFRGPDSGPGLAGRAAARGAGGPAGGSGAGPGDAGAEAPSRPFACWRLGPPDPGGGASFSTGVRSFIPGRFCHRQIVIRALDL